MCNWHGRGRDCKIYPSKEEDFHPKEKLKQKGRNKSDLHQNILSIDTFENLKKGKTLENKNNFEMAYFIVKKNNVRSLLKKCNSAS